MNTVSLIIGNICSLLAMITDAISSTRKTAKSVLWVQNISQLIYFTGTVVLKGYSGAAQNFVSLLRNLVAIRNIQNKFIEWSLAGLGVVLGVCFNNIGILGLLPVIANLQYTLCIFRFKDNERALKVSFWICVGMFILFNLAICNFVGAASNFVVFVTTGISIFKGKSA